jgi:ribosomal protein S18 acetylase RimI-like enzyme
MATVQQSRLMSIRAMEQTDLPAAQKLSMGERWPHRINDWQMMLDVGQGLVAEMNDEIIATAMWFPAGEDRGTLGMVIVSRRHRGAGIGRLMTEAAIERCGYPTLLLNATAAGLPLYRRLGFRGIGEIAQHQGAAFAAPIAVPEEGERIRPIGSNDRDRVRAMVADATGLDRTTVLDAALEHGQGVALARDERLIGVALSRRFGRGYAIGPVIAPDLGRAKTLISHWLGARAGSFTRIDVPSDCGLCDWLDELQVTRVAGVVTMVRGSALADPADDGRSFAILAQALG